MRLSPKSRASLGVVALLATTLFFASPTQAEPRADATHPGPDGTARFPLQNSKRLALDDVDVDALLAVVDPDTAKKDATKKSDETPAVVR